MAWYPDFNNNGIPDYKEPLIWRLLGGFVAKIVMTFAAEHTVAYKVSDLFVKSTK